MEEADDLPIDLTVIAMEEAGGLTTIDLAVIGAYMLATLGMGFVIARRQKSTDDFFIAGRSLPSWAVGLSLLASLLSTISYLAVPGEMYRSGLAYMSRQLALPLVLIVVWCLWLPFFMRLRLTSAYEYLERRFDRRTRSMASVLCIALLLGWMAVVVLTASRAMEEIANLKLAWFFGTGPDADMHAIILGIGLFSVVYTTMGGIRAVVWTDVIQFMVLVGGALFTIGFISWTTNSNMGDWMTVANEYKYREEVQWFDWDLGNRSTIFAISLSMFFWYVCTHGANQVALQRYFTVGSVKQARASYLINAVASICLLLILASVGLALMYYLEQPGVNLPAEEHLLSNDSKIRAPAQDDVFPQFIRYYLPTGLRGLVVAALFAAAMSTIDSGANSISTIVTVDFFRTRNEGKIDVKGELTLARRLTAAMGLVIVIVTVCLYHASKDSDIITLMQKGFNWLLGPLGALFVLGMFSKKAVAKTVIPAVIIGEAFALCSSYSEEWFGLAFSTHLVVPASWTVTMFLGHLFHWTLNTRASEKQLLWRWVEVVKTKPPSDSA